MRLQGRWGADPILLLALTTNIASVRCRLGYREEVCVSITGDLLKQLMVLGVALSELDNMS